MEREAAEARVQDMTMEDTIKFVALNRTEDTEMRKDVSKLDLDSKSLQQVKEMIYSAERGRHLLHQETTLVRQVHENGNPTPPAPAVITCFRCGKPHYKSHCLLPKQECSEENCSCDHTKSMHSSYQWRPKANQSQNGNGSAKPKQKKKQKEAVKVVEAEQKEDQDLSDKQIEEIVKKVVAACRKKGEPEESCNRVTAVFDKSVDYHGKIEGIREMVKNPTNKDDILDSDEQCYWMTVTLKEKSSHFAEEEEDMSNKEIEEFVRMLMKSYKDKNSSHRHSHQASEVKGRPSEQYNGVTALHSKEEEEMSNDEIEEFVRMLIHSYKNKNSSHKYAHQATKVKGRPSESVSQ